MKLFRLSDGQKRSAMVLLGSIFFGAGLDLQTATLTLFGLALMCIAVAWTIDKR